MIFRGIDPMVDMGTASDRYSGWTGQIYTPGRYQGRITRRTRRLAGTSFVEEVLPVESVKEYFEHFGLLEIDFTFYRPLLEWDDRPTDTYHALKSYRRHLQEGDLLLLKAPQTVFARKIMRHGSFEPNEEYLDADGFTRRFMDPATRLLGTHLGGVVFEQEYHRKAERLPPAEMAASLEGFFEAVPPDGRYHVELRTSAYLVPEVFEALGRHGVGQVLSHWTWLPSLKEQFDRSNRRFLNGGGCQVIRLMTPRGVKYEDAYAMAYPFDRLVDGMMTPGMVEETVEIVREAVSRGVRAQVIVNNRSGGNAPLVAEMVAHRLLDVREEGGPGVAEPRPDGVS